MRTIAVMLALAGALAEAAALHTAEPRPLYQQRWFYVQINLQVEKNADLVIALLARAAKSGYNGMVLADYKFNILDRVPAHYFRSLARVRKAAADAGIEIIPTVAPIGYGAGLLAHDPNLAEGLPVKAAPFVVKGREALPAPSTPLLRNGGLEQTRGDRFAGFGFQDEPGKKTFADHKVKRSGAVSCRMQGAGSAGKPGNCRLIQSVTLRPYACYRFSAWVKTKDLASTSAFRLLVMGKNNRSLTFHEGGINSTQDWKEIDVVFNSLDQSEVSVYVGQWGGTTGTLWLDDLHLDEVSLVNVLRRQGCPFVVASADGKTVYAEGKDYQLMRDPLLGRSPWAGEYSFRHKGPTLRLTADSRIKDGDRLRVSWYHPVLTHGSQMMCCLSEPMVLEILRDQVRRVNEVLKPRTFFMSHDEIRVAGWCRACEATKKTPGALLAANVKRCTEIIKEISPKARIVVWSDMFDPNHNAVDRYYLVNGTLKGSWLGLPKDVVIANWNGGKSAQSLKWFADRGHHQIIAGYYDGDLSNFRRWHAAAKGATGVTGFLYTTWQGKYEHLEAYGKAMMGKE